MNTVYKIIVYSTLSSIIWIGCKTDNNTPIELNITVASISDTVGSTGDEITIVGSNFRAAPSENIVAFNGVVGEVVSATTTQLKVIVPEQATSGPLKIGNVQTAQGIIAGHFTILSAIGPTIEEILDGNRQAPTKAFSAGELIIIRGKNFDNNAKKKCDHYKWGHC